MKKRGISVNTRKLILYIILGVLIIIVFFPGLKNEIRYNFEKTFGKPLTFFYSCGIGVMNGEHNYYDDEYQIDDVDEIKVNLTKYVKQKFIYMAN